MAYRSWLSWAFAGIVVFVALDARADAASSAAAQSLFDDAKRLMGEGNYVAACPKLESSQQMDPAPGTQFQLAACYEHTGRTASAWALFLEVSAAARARGLAKHDQAARERADALQPKLSKLTIEVPSSARVEGLEVKRDGVLIAPALWGTPIAIDPGKHPLVASAPGRKAYETVVELGANADQKIVTVPMLVSLTEGQVAGAVPVSSALPGAGLPPDAGKSSPSDSSSMRTASYVALGVGVVGLAAGTFFVMQSSSKRSDADAKWNECGGSGCLTSDPRASEVQSLDSEAAGAKTRAIIGYVVGGLGVAGGATLWALSRPQKNTTGSAVVAPWIGLGSAGVSGSF